MGGDFSGHTRDLFENAVVFPRTKAASTPVLTLSARSSLPSAQSTSPQNEMRSLSCRLYRLTLRSREKSIAAARFSSVIPSMRVRGSKTSQSLSFAQSRRVARPSRQVRSGCFGIAPERFPPSRLRGTHFASAGSLGARKSTLLRRLKIGNYIPKSHFKLALTAKVVYIKVTTEGKIWRIRHPASQIVKA